MNWDSYEIYHPGVFGPLHTLPRAEARRAFNQLMDAKPGRITRGKKNVSYQRHVIMGFAQVIEPKYNIDIDAAVAAYAHRIVASRGSVPHYGRVTIRGVEIDVDAVTASMWPAEIERDAFWRWVKLAESQA